MTLKQPLPATVLHRGSKPGYFTTDDFPIPGIDLKGKCWCDLATFDKKLRALKKGKLPDYATMRGDILSPGESPELMWLSVSEGILTLHINDINECDFNYAIAGMKDILVPEWWAFAVENIYGSIGIRRFRDPHTAECVDGQVYPYDPVSAQIAMSELAAT